MEIIENVLVKNGLLFAFLLVGIIMYVSSWLSKNVFKGKLPGVGIAIFGALALATFGGKKGLADISIFSGLALMGGSMLRDFSVVATAMGADLEKIRKAGMVGIISLFVGILVAFVVGVVISYIMGYRDPVSLTTIGAGSCTYIVGPVTGSALGASSEVLAISIAAGVIKTIVVTIVTPMIAPLIRLNNPRSAVVFGGLMGTTSGVAAGLAATDPELVPYGAMTATFYTGLGCLLCPSILFFLVKVVV